MELESRRIEVAVWRDHLVGRQIRRGYSEARQRTIDRLGEEYREIVSQIS